MNAFHRACLLFFSILPIFEQASLSAEPGDPIAIVAGQTLPGTIADGDIDEVEYNAQAGEQITVYFAFVEGAGGSPTVSILDPGGALVASSRAIVANVVSLPWTTLPIAGSYRIVVSGDAGNYRLSVMSNSRPNLSDEGEQSAILAGQTISGAMPEGELDIVDYVARDGEQIALRFAFVQGGGGTPTIALTDPAGNLVASNWSAVSDVAALGLTSLPTAGTYRILLSGGVGAYRLTAVSNPGPNLVDEGDAASLIAGQSVSGSMAEGEADVITYVGRAGDFVQAVFTFVGGGAWNPAITITDPQGAVVASTFSVVSAVTVAEGTLTRDGTHQIHLSGGVGAYKLTIVSNPGPNPGDEDSSSIVPGLPLAPTMAAGDVDVFYFDAIAGDRVRIEVSALEYPIVSLYGPSGFLQSATSLVSDSIDFSTDCLPESGRYLVVTRGAPATEPYRIMLGQSPGPIPPEFPNDYMQILQCGDVISVRWRAAATGYILQKASTLPAGAPVPWTNVDGPYQPSADYLGASFPVSVEQQYFRLIKPE